MHLRRHKLECTEMFVGHPTVDGTAPLQEKGGKPVEIQQPATLRMALPVNAEEREEVRAPTWRSADHVFETRSV